MNSSFNGVSFDGNGSSSILSMKEIERIREKITYINREVNGFVENVTLLLNEFGSQEVVQSLFRSGNFGTDKQERLLRIKNAIIEYKNIVLDSDSSLVKHTLNYLDEQERLINHRDY